LASKSRVASVGAWAAIEPGTSYKILAINLDVMLSNAFRQNIMLTTDSQDYIKKEATDVPNKAKSILSSAARVAWSSTGISFCTRSISKTAATHFCLFSTPGDAIAMWRTRP